LAQPRPPVPFLTLLFSEHCGSKIVRTAGPIRANYPRSLIAALAANAMARAINSRERIARRRCVKSDDGWRRWINAWKSRFAAAGKRSSLPLIDPMSFSPHF
jgi:hypothetical protein